MGRFILLILLVSLSVGPVSAQQPPQQPQQQPPQQQQPQQQQPQQQQPSQQPKPLTKPLQGAVQDTDSGIGTYKPPKLFPVVPPKVPGADDVRSVIPPPPPPVVPFLPPRNPASDQNRTFIPIKQVPKVQPKIPSLEDLRPVQGAISSLPPSGAWSMTILPINKLSLMSPDITWSVEYGDSRMKDEWDAWLSRVMLVIYQDCSRFKCPEESDHICKVNVRKDGVVVVQITPDGDVPSILFRNALTRLQGQQILDFPNYTKQEKIEFDLNLHYGRALPNSSVYHDAFGQPDARFPLQKQAW